MRILTAFALFLAGGAALAQCPGGRCPAPTYYQPAYNPFVTQVYPLTPSYAAPAPKTGKLEWRKSGDEWHLYRDGVQVAGYRPATGEFLPILADREWAVKWPPCDPPDRVEARANPPAAKGCKCGEQCKCGQDPCLCYVAEAMAHTGLPAYMLNGVDQDEVAKASAGGPKYQIKTEDASRERAFAAVEAASLADDSGRIGAVVYIGPDADKARSDWKTSPKLDGVRGDFAFQAYKPDDKAAAVPKARGYAEGLYVVDNGGKPLAQPVAAYPGDEKLGGLLDRIKNPEVPRPPLIQPKIDLNVPAWGWLAGVGVLCYLLGKKNPAK